MIKKNRIEFETDTGTEYVFLTDSCLVFEKSQINSEDETIKHRINMINHTCQSFANSLSYKNNISNIQTLKEDLYRNGFKELILEVTTSCNLRCKYCIFSGNYTGQRQHGNRNMDEIIALKAIKMYFNYYLESKKYNPNNRPSIAFFGGEPLLNMPLIKKCLAYINSIFSKQDNVYLTITTNATLLNNEIINFFKKQNVHVVVSLDGPKEIHDANRIFPKGEGTFNTVMKNIHNIYSINNKPVFINSVYDYNTNLEKVFNFFDENQILMNLGISPVRDNNGSYYKKFSENTRQKFIERKFNLEKTFQDKILKKREETIKYNFLPFVGQFFGREYSIILMKQVLQYRDGCIKFTGSCIPGQKIFVDTEGTLYPCEKVDRDFIIGNVKDGLNFSYILETIKEFNDFFIECKDCPIHNVCQLCYCYLRKNGKFFKDKQLCNNIIDIFINRLSKTYSALEKDPFWFRFFLDKYYGEFKKWEVLKKC
ncbi:radical SAM protein [Clostridium tyrobutyricum]|uniref:radical SAM protein n=1 Tax=Clostridium tyrobutyricum TaxID=1519 RepID=UPI001C381A0B|nr:radical SAM protein [Clostridium tyrobutyricum]MBV4431671.1 radical SAM protein [Clostridium tyrobutyricum]